ncbi:hypothetical protein C8Q74DRAFT_581043 [Fomes fomentarius]|nr:hypothetical protein C8Q74DRAFT_581043 [Fomes fomentarius]
MATLFSVSYFNLYVFALVLAPQNQTPSTRLTRSHPLYRHRRRRSDINSSSLLASPHGLVAPEKSNVGKQAYALKTLYYLRTLFCINLCFKLSRCQLCKSHQPVLPGRTRGWFGFRFSYGIVDWDSVLACHARPMCSIHWPFVLRVTQPHHVSGPGPNRKTVNPISPSDSALANPASTREGQNCHPHRSVAPRMRCATSETQVGAESLLIAPSSPANHTQENVRCDAAEEGPQPSLACRIHTPVGTVLLQDSHSPFELISAFYYLYYPIRPLPVVIQLRIFQDSVHVTLHPELVVTLSHRAQVASISPIVRRDMLAGTGPPAEQHGDLVIHSDPMTPTSSPSEHEIEVASAFSVVDTTIEGPRFSVMSLEPETDQEEWRSGGVDREQESPAALDIPHMAITSPGLDVVTRAVDVIPPAPQDPVARAGFGPHSALEMPYSSAACLHVNEALSRRLTTILEEEDLPLHGVTPGNEIEGSENVAVDDEDPEVARHHRESSLLQEPDTVELLSSVHSETESSLVLEGRPELIRECSWDDDVLLDILATFSESLRDPTDDMDASDDNVHPVYASTCTADMCYLLLDVEESAQFCDVAPAAPDMTAPVPPIINSDDASGPDDRERKDVVHTLEEKTIFESDGSEHSVSKFELDDSASGLVQQDLPNAGVAEFIVCPSPHLEADLLSQQLVHNTPLLSCDPNSLADGLSPAVDSYPSPQLPALVYTQADKEMGANAAVPSNSAHQVVVIFPASEHEHISQQQPEQSSRSDESRLTIPNFVRSADTNPRQRPLSGCPVLEEPRAHTPLDVDSITGALITPPPVLMEVVPNCRIRLLRSKSMQTLRTLVSPLLLQLRANHASP